MTTRTDTRGIPQATSFKIGRCGYCPHIHIDLKDEDGEVFATMAITNEQAIAIGIEGDSPADYSSKEPTQ